MLGNYPDYRESSAGSNLILMVVVQRGRAGRTRAVPENLREMIEVALSEGRPSERIPLHGTLLQKVTMRATGIEDSEE